MNLKQLKTNTRAAGWKNPWTEADERALVNGCEWREEKANHAVRFFEEFLNHTMGQFAGQPFRLLEWQKRDVIRPLYGWFRADGQRRYSKGDVFVAKKQGKSTLAAGITLYSLLMGGERAEVYGVAHTRDQASIIYREAAAMARASKELKKHVKPLDSRRRLVIKSSQSFYQALAGESSSRGAEGINPVAVIFDEIHVQRSRELYDALAYASAARPNSLMLSVSTVGVHDITTIWWEQYQYAKGILSGELHDDSRFAYICQADPICAEDKEKRSDPAQWRKAMPSLGVTVTEDKVREALVEAENSPAKMGNFLRYMLNIPTQTETRCIPVESWKACYTEHQPTLVGRDCYVGIDLASSEDLTAAVFFFPGEDDQPGYVLPRFWCPQEKINERIRRQMAFYKQWVDEGWLNVTEGERIDHVRIAAELLEEMLEYRPLKVLFDPWNADAVIHPLQEEGFECVEVKQTFTGMSNYIKRFIDAIVKGEIEHDGNPVMQWCCNNATAEHQYGDAIRLSKQKSADKIDGAVAGAMAVGFGLLDFVGSTDDLIVFTGDENYNG